MGVFTVERADEVYPEIVKAVMPTWSLGLFAAVLLGSVLSTFNSALNSASTMFGLEIYKVFINKEASDDRVVKVAGIFGATLTVVSFVIAPQLAHVDSIFSFLQQANSIVSLPIVTVFFVGIATALPDALSARVGFVVALVACGLGQLVDGLHFLHLFFVCFLLAAAAMALVTYAPALRTSLGLAAPVLYQQEEGANKVDITPWKFLYPVIGMILTLLAILIVALQIGSP